MSPAKVLKLLDDPRWSLRIVGLAILLRVFAALVWQNQCAASGVTLKFGDSQSYWTIAHNLVVNGEYQYGSGQSRIFRAPVYPLFLSLFAWCEHSLIGGLAQTPFVLAARLAGCVLGGGIVWLLMFWTRQIAGPRASCLSGILAATYSGAVGMSIFVLSEAVATPLFVLSCWMLWSSTRRSSQIQDPTNTDRAGLYWSAGSGVAFGLACLARPSWGLWPAVAFPMLLIASNRHGHNKLALWLKIVGIFLASATLVMAPWWIRNFAITGKFVPTTLQVGASLYDGWHAGASGSSDENMEFSMNMMHRIVQEEGLLASNASSGLPLESTLEWRIDRRLSQEAWKWARENPSDVAKLGLVKFVKTWSPMPRAQELSNPMIRYWEAGGYLIILGASAFGLYVLRKDRRRLTDAVWFALPCIYLALLHMVFIGSVRYRQPGVLLLCGLAGIGFSAMIEMVFPILKPDWASRQKDAVGNKRE